MPPNGWKAKAKACPFCEFSMTSVEQTDNGRYVLCGDCGARGPWTKQQASAIAMWNKRERDRLHGRT
jgi:Lar family restriction alleviation protein